MVKLTVGIIVSESYKPACGGAHSYYQRLLSAIDEFDFDEKLEIVFISFSRDIRLPTKKRLVTVDIPSFIQKNIYDSAFSKLNRLRFCKFFIEKVFNRPADFVINNKIEKTLSDKG